MSLVKKINRLNPKTAAAFRQARDKAESAATPAVVLKSVFPPVIQISGRQLQPFRLNTFRALEAIKSPLPEMVLGRKPKEAATEMDFLRALLICSMPLPEARALIRLGPAAVDAAAELLGDELPPSALFEVGKGIAAHLAHGFSTMIPDAVEDDPDPVEKKAAGVDPTTRERTADATESATASVGR